MDGAVTEKLGVGEPWNHPEDALLFRDAKPRLKADEVPHATRAILLTKLHDGIRIAPGARITEPDRLERTEAERVAPSARHLLDRHAPLEVRRFIELVAVMLIGLDQRIDERLVLLAREWTVEIRAVLAAPRHRLLAVARRTEH